MRGRAGLALVGVLVAVALPYLSGLDNGFVWLDHLEIVEGALVVRDLTDVPGLFLDDRSTLGYHRPIYNLLHSLNLALWGLEPRGFLLCSLGLHLLNCALGFALLRRHGRSVVTASAVVLLFGLHPVNTAVVGLIHSIADELFVAGALGAWLLFARAETETESKPARGLLWALSLACLLVGLGSKENAFLYAPVVALAAFTPWTFAGGIRPSSARLRAYAVAVILVTAGVGVVRIGEVGAQAPALGGALQLGERLLTFAGVYVDYWKKLLVPFDLSICDTVTRFSALAGTAKIHTLGSALILIAGQAALWVRVPRLRPWIALANLSLLPVAQIVPILHFRADRFLYLATLAAAGGVVEGASVLRGHLAERGVPERRLGLAFGGALGLAVVLCAGRILPRLARFENDETLFRSELERTVDYREGLSQLARHYDRTGRFDAAGELYERALAPYPGRVSYVDLEGVMLARSKNLLARGRLEEAYELAREQQRLVQRPRLKEELEYNLAVAAYRLGRHDEALEIFGRYARAHPRDPSCHYLLGRTALALGEDALARRALERYLALAPGASDRAQVEGLLAGLSD